MAARVGDTAGLVAASIHEEVHITNSGSEPIGQKAVSISVDDLDVGCVCVSQARGAAAPLALGWIQT